MKQTNMRKVLSKIFAVLMTVCMICSGMVSFGKGQTQEAYAAAVNEIRPGDHITFGKTDAAYYSGTPYWRVLDTDEDGNMLFVSEYLWTGNGTNDAEATIKFDPENTSNSWQGSSAQSWCARFAEAVLADVPGIEVLETTKSDAEYTYTYGNYTRYTFYSRENILNKDKVFFLSAEEVVKYFPNPEDRIAYMTDGTTTGLWLLRSALKSDSTDSGYTNRVGEILKGTSTSGAMNAVSSWTGTAARPAFWGKMSSDLCLKKVQDGDHYDWTVQDINHSLSDPSYTWSDDHSTCTAKAMCSNCDDEIAETVNSTSSVTKEPTTTEEGLTVFTAQFSISGFETQTADEPIEKLKPSDEPAKTPTSAPVTINKKTVNAAAVKKAVQAVQSRGETPSEFVLGSKVKKISKKAFKGTSVKTLVVKTKKLTKKSVKGSLKGSKVKTVKVKVAKKAKTNKKYVKKYKKIFTKKNAGKKVKVTK